jgi:carbamoyltransferase
LKLLGISSHYHDSAAAIIVDGEIIAAVQEERFTRIKHDKSFPEKAILSCLEQAGLSVQELDGFVYYDKPLLTFERLLETYLAFAPRGLISFIAAMPVWLEEKLYLKQVLKKELAELAGCSKKELPQLYFAEHHQSHAASAFFPSPFERAAVLCMDGVGEWATLSVWLGEASSLKPCWELHFPHSLGMLYSAFTYYLGFKVNSGEYKVMGLAPYGNPIYADLIFDHLLDLKEDGTFRLDMRYFNYAKGLTMTSKLFHDLFGEAPRKPESEITQREMDLARSLQLVTEEIVLRLARGIHKELDCDYLCLAGGVALNCVANGRLLREGPFKDIWIQPAAGDAGGAIGSALAVHYDSSGSRHVKESADSMKGSYLGPHYDSEAVKSQLAPFKAVYSEHGDEDLFQQVAKLIANGNVVGWFQGRMEFGPRALGNRSILGDPRSAEMQATMNMKIKYRESFRPFAPSIKEDRIADWFDLDRPSPYMLMVSPLLESERREPPAELDASPGLDRVNQVRSTVPAITHLDYTARIQTVNDTANPRFFKLLDAFEALTGCPMVVNTSFNVRGEPLVCTPSDAYRCFMRTEMEYLIMENCILEKTQQPPWHEKDDWRSTFQLD